MDDWARYKKRELNVLLIDGEEEDGLDYLSSEPPMSPTEELITEVTIHPEVSLNSVVGLSNPKTMKLRGIIAGKEVIVMIDPGTMYNFLSLSTVAELDIPVEEAAAFEVSLGNGDAIRGKGI